MGDYLEFNDISSEIRGAMTPGRLKLAEQNIIFKNSKTGKIDQIPVEDVDLINSQKYIASWGLRVFTKSGNLHRFVGFKESDKEKVAKYLKKVYKQEMVEKELCVKGWNWGTTRFYGSILSFDKDDRTIFEVPLSYVSQCMTGKNEVTMEFHQNDDAPVGLIEMRFHIPQMEATDEDPVEAFQKNVLNKASVISASGDAIAIFREIHCLTPRGRYDIKIFSTFFQLHGKTFDYKVPMNSVLRLFLLPHKDQRQMFFVLSLDPPIKQGQTRYHFLVLLFAPDEEMTMVLPFTEEELKEKYEGRIEKELSGPVYEVMGKVMKVLIGRKITGPGNFIGHSGTAAVGCSFKAAAGYLYPLERGFMYIHKPPIHIRFEEVASVNFARSGGSTRSFDFEITLKNGTMHIFSSIEKEEYAKLFDYISEKKLHVSNMGKDKGGYKDSDFADSDNENEPDAYLARVKAEAREKDSAGSEDESSTDEDFKPEDNESDVAEEYDSNASSGSDDSESDEHSGGGGRHREGSEHRSVSPEKKKKKTHHSSPKKEKKEHKAEKKKRSKDKKDSDKPKRATTAFMLWLNEMREQIRRENPGIKVTEIAKKGGEMWKELKDKTKWEEKAAKDKQRYVDEMKEYKGKDGEGKRRQTSEKSPHSSSFKKSVNTSGSSYKSKEYISDDDDSDSSSDRNEKKEKMKAKADESLGSSNRSEDGDDGAGSNKDEDDEKSEKASSADESADSDK